MEAGFALPLSDDKPQPAHDAPARRFAFVERDDHGEAREHDIHSVERPRPLDFNRLVDQYVHLLSTDRRGTVRREDAGFQNMLVRALRRGQLDEGFFPQFRDEVATRLMRACDADVSDQGSGRRNGADSRSVQVGFGNEREPLAVRMESLERGVRSAVEAIGVMERNFEQRLRPADLRQMIGTNDFLDAADKVDFLEIHYQERGDGQTDIRVIRLVQVKAGGRLLSSEGVREIQEAHARLVKRLSSPAEYASSQVAAAERTLSSGAFFQREMEKRKESAADLHGFLDRYFGQVVFELLTLEKMDDAAVEEAVRKAEGLSSAVLKLVFNKLKAKALFLTIADGWGAGRAQANAAFEMLRDWTQRHPPSLEELRDLLPPGKSAPKLSPAVRFESVILDRDLENLLLLSRGEAGSEKAVLVTS